MGIRIKNLHNYILELKIVKTLSATLKVDAVFVPFAGKISNVVATITTPGSGATNTILDVNLNGTTIFASSVKVTFASTTGAVTYSALASQPTDLAAGDILTMDADAVSTAAATAVVLVTVTRTGMGAETNLTDHDTVY